MSPDTGHSATTTEIIRLAGIGKRFPGVRALDNISLSIHAGEIHALTGENGSGKSTLSRIMAGALQPDAGEIYIDDKPVKFSGPADALSAGIVMISQELILAPTLTVAENIFLGRLPRTTLGTIDWSRMFEEAQHVLDRLDVHVSPKSRVSDLSVEMRQEVEIARALSANARVLILDEATSSLSEAAPLRLLDLVRKERDAGMAIVMITHRMREIYGTADLATVLRDGRKMATVPLPDTDQAEIVRLMVGREISDFYGKRNLAKGAVVLQVEGLHTKDNSLSPVSFEVRAGEIFGIAGLVGSGKSEIGLALGGAIAAAGTVRVDGRSVKLGEPRSSILSGIGFVPDDRKSAALLMVRDIRENFSLAWNRLLLNYGVLNIALEGREVSKAMQTYRVGAGSPNVAVAQLSGGNQQKVILGRTFRLGPQVLVLSEPTRGIDVGAKSEIYAMLQDAAEKGAAVIIISSDLPELLGIADKIAVCFEGSIGAIFDRAEASEEAIAHVAVAGPQPYGKLNAA